MLRAAIVVLVVLAAAPCLAQQGVGNECTPAGTWYGGSVTAYQMTIVPSVPAGHYTIMFQGFYKTAVMASAVLTGELVRKGDKYEGAIMGLGTQDQYFLGMPPFDRMPDIEVGWVSLQMTDCNTIKNIIPFFGLYFGANAWSPALTGATFTHVRPMVDPPDVDWLNVLTGGYPIIENYRRLPNTVNPALLHK